MTTAVTAASGALGTAIINRLVLEIGGENVIALARTVSKVNAPEKVEVRPGDYEKPEELRESLAGVDTLLMVSGNAPPAERIKQHQNVVDAAKAAGVRKLVYTGIAAVGESPIAAMSKDTEDYIRDSGLEWAVGRNGLYLEPDLEYIETYVKEGGIINCAGNGRCCYTSRGELADAYVKMITEDSLTGGTYNLGGEAITQDELADIMNEVFGTSLKYREMDPEDYEADRKAELGDFMGKVIAEIYRGIRAGLNEFPSDYSKVVGRPHKTVLEMARDFLNSEAAGKNP